MLKFPYVVEDCPFKCVITKRCIPARDAEGRATVRKRCRERDYESCPRFLSTMLTRSRPTRGVAAIPFASR